MMSEPVAFSSLPTVIVWRCGAAQNRSRCLHRYLTPRLEQFRSNLPLRALTYSVLSREDILPAGNNEQIISIGFPAPSGKETTSSKFRAMIKNCWFSESVYNREQFPICFILHHMLYLQFPFTAHIEVYLLTTDIYILTHA